MARRLAHHSAMGRAGALIFPSGVCTRWRGCRILQAALERFPSVPSPGPAGGPRLEEGPPYDAPMFQLALSRPICEILQHQPLQRRLERARRALFTAACSTPGPDTGCCGAQPALTVGWEQLDLALEELPFLPEWRGAAVRRSKVLWRRCVKAAVPLGPPQGERTNSVLSRTFFWSS
jgi:hypothetical protein